MVQRPKMVGWYTPRLIATAVSVAISTAFGQFADRREMEAAGRKIDPDKLDDAYDYRDALAGQDFWFDFFADTGDGWNSTYAVARLLAEPVLKVAEADTPLPRGRILVMGGDQVYPTPSREAYQERLIVPFEAAAKGQIDPDQPPHLYAIPGNHDWYDGLLTFLSLFCRRRKQGTWNVGRRGRTIGGRETQQTRSYFALALPRGWWLWAADVQLAGYIDQPQIDFFTHVARDWMDDNSRLILCTGMPSWAYVDVDDPTPAFRNFSYLERLARLANKGHRLCAVLTGDSHHYSRYTEGEGQAGCHYITAGGGGAFLHPTHHLEDKKFDWRYSAPNAPANTPGPPFERKFTLIKDADNNPLTFPDQATSRKLSYRDLLFALLNWQYTLTLAVACGVFAWLLDANARFEGSTLLQNLTAPAGFWGAVCAYVGLVFVSPWPVLLVGGAVGGYYYLADFKPWQRRLAVGGLHAAVQTGVVMLATIVLARWLTNWPDWLFILLIGAVGGILAATILGTYFLLCLNVFKNHWNEAFSALRIADYKNFLRLRIKPDGELEIYPVGLTKTPRDDSTDSPKNPPLEPHLIEGPIPIR